MSTSLQIKLVTLLGYVAAATALAVWQAEDPAPLARLISAAAFG